jgi:phospholipase/lecithinase/hemolysin
LLQTLLALQVAVSGPAGAFSEVVFFGDSLSDTGNTCATVASLGGGFAAGRCSNGPVWADYLVAGLGLGAEATSSASGGSNYANGGARTLDLAAQIGAYTSAGSGAADPEALHVVWLGGNDVLFEVILASGGPDAMQAAAARIGAGIESLATAGARHFLVANAPDVGRVYGNPLLNPPFAPTSTPLGEADRAVLTALSLEFNAALDDVLGSVSVESLVEVDIFAPFAAMIDDPAAFGFSPGAVDTDSQLRSFPIACLADPACAAAPQGAIADGFLVFDSVHPTTALHRVIADGALAAVVPEPGTGVLLALGLAWLVRNGAARPTR